MIRLTLPIPPSTNALFLNNGRGHGRRVSPAYSAWHWAALQALRGHVYEAIVEGKWRMTVRVPRAMRGDVDNRIKAVSDFLVDHHVTLDDKHCDHAEALRDDAVPAGRCVVEIESLDPVQAVAGARGAGASASAPSIQNTEGTGAGA